MSNFLVKENYYKDEINKNFSGDELKKKLDSMNSISNKEQQKIFKNWLINILRSRFKDNIDTSINRLLKETSELEVEDMVSNLGKTIERAFKTSEKRGIKQGIEKGIEKGKEETAVNLLKLGIAEEIIAKGTGLSLEKILELKQKFAN